MNLPTAAAASFFALAMGLPVVAQGYSSGDESSFDQGMQLVMAGEFRSALPLLSKSASQGDRMAQYAAAMLIRRGYGTAANPRRAVALLEQAIQGPKRFPDALAELADCLAEGAGVQRNAKRAVQLSRQAAECGNGRAMFNLGIANLSGRHVPKNVPLAFAWFALAADRKQPYAINNVAGVAKMMNTEQQAKGKELLAQMRKAKGFAGGTIQFQFSLKSAETAAMHKGRKAYEARRLEEARARLTPLALQGQKDALFYVARMHETGRGFQQDFLEAARLYLVAIRRGEGTSIGNLARLFEKGLGVQKSQDNAVALWRVGRWWGDPDCQNKFALASIQGKGTRRDPQQAFVWWTIAAEKGKQQAKNNLKILLEQDLPQDQLAAAQAKLQQVRAMMKNRHSEKLPELKIGTPRLLAAKLRKPKKRSYEGEEDVAIEKKRRRPYSGESEEIIEKPKPDSRGNLERHTSPDGKMTIMKPRGWKVKQGDLWNNGLYGVTCENAAETAGVIFMVIPGGDKKFNNSKDFSKKMLQGFSGEWQNLQVTSSMTSPDGSKTLVNITFTEEGKHTTGTFQFSVSKGEARMMGFGAETNIWKQMQPTLQQSATSLRYPVKTGKVRRF